MKAKIIPKNDAFRRVFKLITYVLNDKCKFGHDKIAGVLSKISELSLERETDEAFWEHLDNIVIDRLKFEFDRENYSEVNNPKLFAGVPKQKPLSLAERQEVEAKLRETGFIKE